MADNVAHRYVYNGDHDCDSSYWENIIALLNEETINIDKELD